MTTPSPLTKPGLDLRDMPYMPLDVVRLRDSDIAALANGDAFRAAVLLWCAAWHQVPSASLPTDDANLARYAGFGRDVRGWKRVKEAALRGFVRCTDGRLYHPVIAEKAIEADTKRRAYRDRTFKATNARRQRNVERDDQRNDGRNDGRNVERDDDRNDTTTSQRNDHQGKVSKEDKVREERKKEVRGADAPANGHEKTTRQFVFEGQTVRLTQAGLDRWRKAYSAIPDLPAALQAADDYYTQNPPADGKWFFPVSRWLQKENASALERRGRIEKDDLRARGEAW